MLKALIDANVVLDALASREPFRADAEHIFMLAAEEKFQGLISANSITDIYYILSKNVSDATSRKALRNLFQLFTVAGISGEDCETALESPLDDYEDALVAVCATKAEADYIITRDEDFLKARVEVAVVTPAVFLKKF